METRIGREINGQDLCNQKTIGVIPKGKISEINVIIPISGHSFLKELVGLASAALKVR